MSEKRELHNSNKDLAQPVREIVQQPVAQLPSGYAELLEGLKKRIREARVKANLSVNRELVLLYWEIGKVILQRQSQEGWGNKDH